jgi:hypothetical protein
MMCDTLKALRHGLILNRGRKSLSAALKTLMSEAEYDKNVYPYARKKTSLIDHTTPTSLNQRCRGSGFKKELLGGELNPGLPRNYH